MTDKYASGAGNSDSQDLRVLLLTLEYAEPWIFSGNGVYSRSFVHNLTRNGGVKVLVVCGRPAGQQIRSRTTITKVTAMKSPDDASKSIVPINVDFIKESPKIEVRTVSLPVWFKLDRNSSWKEYGEGVSRFAKEVGAFHPDIVLGVDWTSRQAWETLKKNQVTKLGNTPFVYLCFRVFSSTPALSLEDRTFYSQREAETIQAAVRTVALSRCDASALDALRTMTLPRGADALRNSGLIQVIAPPLRDDVRNASLKLTRPPVTSPLIGNQQQNARNKWSSHLASSSRTLAGVAFGTTNTEVPPFTSRTYITCCCRISPEKEVMRFVEIVEQMQHFLKDNELVPYVVGPPADEDYARKVYQRLKRAFPGDSSIVVSDFVPADKLQSIFAKTVLNVHPARMEPFGMTITEAAAFGVPTLLDGSGFIGATDMLPFSDHRSIACNMRSVKQTVSVAKTLLRKEGRSFLELIGKRAQDAILRWGSAQWATHVKRELLDDVLRNAFRAYEIGNDNILTVSGRGRPQALPSPVKDREAIEENHLGDETWPWLPMMEWAATQLSLEDDPVLTDGKVLGFDLDGVRLVVQQLVKLSAYSLASLLLNIKRTKQPAPVEMTEEMYEWAWYFLTRNNICLGPARFRLVPSRMSEDFFWGLFFAVVRDGVVRLMSNKHDGQSPQLFPTTASLSSSDNQENGNNGDESQSASSNQPPSSPQPLFIPEGEAPSFTSVVDLKMEALERLVQRDECGRGIAPIVEFVGKGVLCESARSLYYANRVLILTGFPCLLNSPSPQETDGPPGAVALAKACVSLGKRVFFVIEEPNAGVLRASIAQVFPKTKTLLLRSHGLTKVESFGPKGQVTLEIFPTKANFTKAHYDRLEEIVAELTSNHGHVIAIERAGPGKDGQCRTFRGRIMGDDLLAPLHMLFDRARQANVPTTGIGDGGNEVGMGNAYEIVQSRISVEVACVIGCEFLIPCSVSNWGGHALCAALALVALEHQSHFQGTNKNLKAIEACIGTDKQLEQVVRACLEAGAADGMTGNRDFPSVDGLPFSKTLEVIQALRAIVDSFVSENDSPDPTVTAMSPLAT